MSELLADPLVVCEYGWGRLLRLYADGLELDGILYALDDLVQIYPTYHQFMGVASARLEFVFQQKRVVVRGIAEVEAARRIVDYLLPRIAQLSSPDGKALSEVSQCAASSEILSTHCTDEVSVPPRSEPLVLSADSAYSIEERAWHEQAQASTQPIEVPYWQRAHREQREKRLRRLQAERSLREHGFDVERLAQHLQQGHLFPVQVPVQLFPGEHAYYVTEATRCGELFSAASVAAEQERRKVKDYGTLIFTGERMIYLGRRGQILLGYGHLLYVSRLRRAVAFMAEHWTERETFEVARPLECTMYLEYILQRFQNLQKLRLEGIRAAQLISHYMIQTCSTSEEVADIQTHLPIEEIDTVQFAGNEADEVEDDRYVYGGMESLS